MHKKNTNKVNGWGPKIPYEYNLWGTQISSNEVHGCATQKTSNKVHAWGNNESQRTCNLGLHAFNSRKRKTTPTSPNDHNVPRKISK